MINVNYLRSLLKFQKYQELTKEPDQRGNTKNQEVNEDEE